MDEAATVAAWRPLKEDEVGLIGVTGDSVELVVELECVECSEGGWIGETAVGEVTLRPDILSESDEDAEEVVRSRGIRVAAAATAAAAAVSTRGEGW